MVYGVNAGGGTFGACCGSVFRMTKTTATPGEDWPLETLHSFAPGALGNRPAAAPPVLGSPTVRSPARRRTVARSTAAWSGASSPPAGGGSGAWTLPGAARLRREAAAPRLAPAIRFGRGLGRDAVRTCRRGRQRHRRGVHGSPRPARARRCGRRRCWSTCRPRPPGGPGRALGRAHARPGPVSTLFGAFGVVRLPRSRLGHCLAARTATATTTGWQPAGSYTVPALRRLLAPLLTDAHGQPVRDRTSGTAWTPSTTSPARWSS